MPYDKRWIKNLLSKKDSATMVEYAFMLAFIALVCVGVVREIGTIVLEFFNKTLAAI